MAASGHLCMLMCGYYVSSTLCVIEILAALHKHRKRNKIQEMMVSNYIQALINVHKMAQFPLEFAFLSALKEDMFLVFQQQKELFSNVAQNTPKMTLQY